jgi:hypothetical protein
MVLVDEGRRPTMDVQALQRQWAEQRTRAMAESAKRLGRAGETEPGETEHDEAILAELGSVWDRAFEAGRLAALDEFQDRFCVCMRS